MLTSQVTRLLKLHIPDADVKRCKKARKGRNALIVLAHPGRPCDGDIAYYVNLLEAATN